jgi:RND family efflux transporter MFP subunit
MSLAREQPRPRSNAWIGAVLALLALLGVGGYLYSRSRPEAATVTRRDILAAVPIAGEVIAPPGERADVYSPYQAPVSKVHTTIGDNVKRGDTIVELSLPNMQAAYEQAKANEKAAETAYANARGQYDSAVGQWRTQVGATAADPSARATAEQGLAQAQAAATAGLAPYQQQLEEARRAVQDARAGKKLALIHAPMAGTVLALNAQPNAMVGTDRKVPVATIVDLDALVVNGEVKANQAGFVKAGMPATIVVEGLPGEQFDGEVKALTTELAGKVIKSQRYVAVVHVKNKGGKVKPGLKATAAVKAGEVKDALAVPNDAVHTDKSGRPVVNVMRGGKWEAAIVEIGMSDGKYTQVKSGLKEGETVQVKPDIL